MQPFLDDYIHTKNLRHHFSFSGNIVDQRNQESNWMRGRTGHTQPKPIFPWNLESNWMRGRTGHTQPYAIFPWLLIPCKKSKLPIDPFHRGCWLKILQSDWMRGTKGYTQPKAVASDPTFPWWLSPCKKSTILIAPSRDTDDQRILPWRQTFPGKCGFHRIIKNTTMHHFWSERRHQWIKSLCKKKLTWRNF